jgi:hypothetical protein
MHKQPFITARNIWLHVVAQGWVANNMISSSVFIKKDELHLLTRVAHQQMSDDFIVFPSWCDHFGVFVQLEYCKSCLVRTLHMHFPYLKGLKYYIQLRHRGAKVVPCIHSRYTKMVGA